MHINEMAQEAWHNSEDHGFHSLEENANFGMRLALIHSELSEALEAYRKNPTGMPFGSWKNGKKPEGVASELADAVIRIGDLAVEHGIDLEGAVIEKMAYNRTRPFLHGGKRC